MQKVTSQSESDCSLSMMSRRPAKLCMAGVSDLRRWLFPAAVFSVAYTLCTFVRLLLPPEPANHNRHSFLWSRSAVENGAA